MPLDQRTDLRCKRFSLLGQIIRHTSYLISYILNLTSQIDLSCAMIAMISFTKSSSKSLTLTEKGEIELASERDPNRKITYNSQIIRVIARSRLSKIKYFKN